VVFLVKLPFFFFNDDLYIACLQQHIRYNVNLGPSFLLMNMLLLSDVYTHPCMGNW